MLEMQSGFLDELSQFDKWVVWRTIVRKDKPTKAPVNCNTGRGARVNDEKSWSTFKTANDYWYEYRDKIDGIGFVLSDSDHYVVVDLDWKDDTSVNPGDIPRWAKRIIRSLRSYTEWSPSKRGVHIWCRGEFPDEARNRKGGVEIYWKDRYLTVTGERIPIDQDHVGVEGDPPVAGEDTDQIEDRQEALEAFHRKTFNAPNPTEAWGGEAKANVEDEDGGDDLPATIDTLPHQRRWTKNEALAVIQSIWRTDFPEPEREIRHAIEIDVEFKRLWERKHVKSTEHLGADHSRWDLAVCNRLMWDLGLGWAQLLGALQAYRRKTALDDKWNRADYWAFTVSTASNQFQQKKKQLQFIDNIEVINASDDDEGEKRARKLEAVNSQMKDSKGRIRKLLYSRWSDILIIEFIDGEEAYSNIDAIRSHAKWDRLLTQYQGVRNPFPPKSWKDTSSALLDIIEEFDDREDASYLAIADEVLMAWAEIQTALPKPNERNFSGDGPWLSANKVRFTYKQVRNFVSSNASFRHLTEDKLKACLKMGDTCAPRVMGTRVEGGASITRKVWAIESPELNDKVQRAILHGDHYGPTTDGDDAEEDQEAA